VFREGNSLLIKVGLIMMALALALVIAALVVSVTLGSEPGRLAAEVASKSVGEASRYSSGEQESSLGYGSFSNPKPRSLDPRRLNLGASKHPLSPNSDHNSTKLRPESNFCRRRKIPTGPGPPKKSYGALTLHATTTCQQGRSWA
jgi:hypothetical protein